MDSEWYKEIVKDDSSLLQGDILCNLRIHDVREGLIKHGNVIVLSQSCDLNKMTENKSVLIATITELKNYLSIVYNKNNNSKKSVIKQFEKINKNQIINMFILDKCNQNVMNNDYILVLFNELFTIGIDDLKDQLSNNRKIKKARLTSPYREKLAHQFGNSFSRVALSNDLNPHSDYFESFKP